MARLLPALSQARNRTLRDQCVANLRQLGIGLQVMVANDHAYPLLFKFCDGHAESLKLKTLFRATNDLALDRWNRDHQPHLDLAAPN